MEVLANCIRARSTVDTFRSRRRHSSSGPTLVERDPVALIPFGRCGPAPGSRSVAPVEVGRGPLRWAEAAVPEELPVTDDRHYDVIIIGTGAGGGTLAHRLAPSGKQVLLLER